MVREAVDMGVDSQYLLFKITKRIYRNIYAELECNLCITLTVSVSDVIGKN